MNLFSLSIENELFIDPEGVAYPVTDWFDRQGCACDKKDAVVCIAGEGEHWYSITISQFGRETLQ